MAEPGWSIEMTRSGGFAGMTVHAQVRGDELTPDEEPSWRALLDQLGDAPSAGGRPGGPDRFQYEFTVRHGGRERHVVFHDDDLPPAARELSQRLVERARRRR
jgi:hypothetical protein